MRIVVLCVCLLFATLALSNKLIATSPTDIKLESFGAAALANDDATMRRHMADPAFAKLVDSDGHSALFVAAHVGRTDLAAQLVASGADINLHDPTGATALFFASANAQALMVQWLIDHGAHIVNGGNYAPLKVASMSGHTEVVRILIKEGALLFAAMPVTQSSEALDVSVAGGRADVVRLLLDTAEAKRMPEEQVSRLKKIALGRKDPVILEVIQKFEMARSNE